MPFVPDTEQDVVTPTAPQVASQTIPEAPPDAAEVTPGFVPDSSESQANAMEAQESDLQQRRGGLAQQAVTGLEQTAKGVLGPIATGFETAPMGLAAMLAAKAPPLAMLKAVIGQVPAEDIREREEANPILSGATNIAGLMAPIGQGAALSEIGGKLAARAIPEVVGEGILAGVKRESVKLAAENALYQAGDETSKMILNDPDQTVGTAAINIGLAGILGGVTGGALAGVSPLWKSAVGDRAAQFISNFQGRMKEHLENPDRTGTFTDELGSFYNNIKDTASEVFGPEGLKSREINKLMGTKGEVEPTYSPEIRQVADQYASDHGFSMEHNPPVPVNPEVGAKIAQAYEAMKHDPANPEVQSAYQALIKETLDQYQYIKNTGLKIDKITPDMGNPYANSKAMLKDIRDNNHLWYFPTEQGFGTEAKNLDHPMLASTQETMNGEPMLANDVFRIVHDYFGHGKEGNGFGPKGEENAWMYHKQMFSPEAQKAMTTETRGQNSWVNYGPHGEANRAHPENTVYADQKAGILPEEFQEKRLVHFSTNPRELKIIEPAMQGTGVKGEEYKRDDRILRSYFYEQGTEHEKFVTGQAKYQYLVKHPGKVLDLASKEAAPILDASRDTHPNSAGGIDATLLEQNIKNAGYNGYQNTKGVNPGVVALFKSAKVQQAKRIGRDLLTSQAQQEVSPTPEDVSNIALKVGLPQAAEIFKHPNTKNIAGQMETLNTKAETALQTMSAKAVPPRYMNKFKADLDQFQSVATDPEASPAELFNATQDFKKTLQNYSKGNWGPFAIPSYHEAYDFLQTTKSLAKDIREGLEDPKVWGEAATRQQAINKAFKDYLPTLQDFERRFTTEVNGVRTVDPGKAATYMGQLGKPSAEIKQDMLRNFMDASEKYKSVIAATHANLGLETPIPSTSTNMIKNSLQDLSPGAKLADLFVKKFGDASGRLLGGAIGGLAGAFTHIPGSEFLGAIVGEHALGPFIGSLLPAIAKPMLNKSASGEGLKAAAEYGQNVIKGQKAIDFSVKSLFKAGSKVVPDRLQATPDDRKKLDSVLMKYQQNPEKLANISGSLNHYLPQHAMAAGGMASNAVQFLNSIRPQNAPKSMLDDPKPVSKAVQAQYDRVLDIANQPLTVLEAIKDNTLTSHDMIALRTIYPSLYTGLQHKIMEQMVSQVAKGEKVPYKTRLGLSLFLGQPLDSTMSPQAISLAQPPPPQPPPQPQGGKKLTQGAASKMLKGSKSSQTPLQASESMHSTGGKA